MKSCLITNDIISSLEWYQKAPKTNNAARGKSWKQCAFEDFVSTLKREKKEFPQAAANGIAFEKAVYDFVCKNIDGTMGTPKAPASEHFNTVVASVWGYDFQVKVKSIEEIAGETCCLYGKLDAKLGNNIVDLKTTASFKPSSYVNSFQHTLYCYIAKAQHFKYIVAEWEKYPKIKGCAHYYG